MSRRCTFVIIVVLVSFLGAACDGKDDDVIPPDKVSIRLSWIPSSEFAGFYAALDQGFYAKENLDVEIKPGGYDADGNYLDPVSDVTEGRADFGIIDSTVLLTARAEGKPLVAIATIFQLHPLALTSLAENNIVLPEDLVGRNVHVSYTSNVVYQALLRSQGINPETVNTVERTDFTTESLLSGDAEVIDAWVVNEVVSLTMEGHDVNIILVSDYGIEVYPDVIFTTESMIRDHRDQVAAFLRATTAGMQYVIDDPQYGGGIVLSHNEALNAEIEVEIMRRSLPLLNPMGSRPGMMQPDVWQYSYEILVEQGLLETGMEVESAYTLEFLNEIYTE